MKLAGLLAALAAALSFSLPAVAQEPAAPPPPGGEFELGILDDEPEFDIVDSGPRPSWGGGPGGQMARPGSMSGHGMPGMGPMGGQRRDMMRRAQMGLPLIRMMLFNREPLGLSPAQVTNLETIRMDYLREVIRRRADIQIARLDLVTLMRPDPADPAGAVDTAKIEGKIREIERMRGDVQVARVRAMEAGKTQLSADQRAKLATLVAEARARWQRGGAPGRPAMPGQPRS